MGTKSKDTPKTELTELRELRNMVSNMFFQYDCAQTLGTTINFNGPMIADIRAKIKLAESKEPK